MPPQPRPSGRGSHLNPPNRFRTLHYDASAEDCEPAEDGSRPLPTQYLLERSRSIITRNDSPDVPFRYSLNPYRGCEHGCSYCYARPTHEYLGYNAGLDFETKIIVKENAPELFRAFLARPEWLPEPIALSGVTDCYQPAERHYRLTRGCLEVAWETRHPLTIITKNVLVLRDLELLRQLAAENLIRVTLSLTTLDSALARSMEPRTSTPAARLRAVQELRAAGVPVGVLLAPIIPGLNDSEIPALLQAAKEAGAQEAGYVLLRLPGAVAPVFQEWLEREQPHRVGKVEARVRDTRGGQLNETRFGLRMCGQGELAAQIRQLFHVFARRHQFGSDLPPLEVSRFRPPVAPSGQGWLF